ncbi:reticulon-like protein B13 [Salvia hispanica]|uniref:reticulon-like protein B13 n=1 Tax=Salvia hispanica TaxID=49212 RepID=UPI00200952E9|nr:reticulon-like protein B13 [Salvia hispanica]
MSELKAESPTSPPPKSEQETSESPTSPPPKAEQETSEYPTSPPPSIQLHSNSDILSEIVLWRRKQLNVGILVAATATWIVMDVYHYSFITLLSWVAIALLSCLFFWGSIHRFLKKEAPDLSELEISEETAKAHAGLLRRRAEDGIRLMFHIGSEREWFVFVGAVVSLYLLSLAAKHLDFVTLCFIGIWGAMTVPVVYVKNEQKIREFEGSAMMTWQRMNVMFEEKFHIVKTKIAGKQKEVKEKKTK